MMTEEDFKNAEEAMNVMERLYEQNPSILYGLTRHEIAIHDFAKKVLAEARRDFLTDKKVVISKMETVQTIPKITPMK